MLIISNLILSGLLLVCFISIWGVTRILSKTTEAYNELLDNQEDVTSIIEFAKQAKIGSKASIKSKVNHGMNSYTLDIPVKLEQKSGDGLRYKFSLNYGEIPDRFPYDDDEFMQSLEFYMDSWYDIDSDSITWHSLSGVDFNFSEEESKEISDLIEFSARLSKKSKKAIKSILKLK